MMLIIIHIVLCGCFYALQLCLSLLLDRIQSWANVTMKRQTLGLLCTPWIHLLKDAITF